jgi:hypothetical protein
LIQLEGNEEPRFAGTGGKGLLKGGILRVAAAHCVELASSVTAFESHLRGENGRLGHRPFSPITNHQSPLWC